MHARGDVLYLLRSTPLSFGLMNVCNFPLLILNKRCSVRPNRLCNRNITVVGGICPHYGNYERQPVQCCRSTSYSRIFMEVYRDSQPVIYYNTTFCMGIFTFKPSCTEYI